MSNSRKPLIGYGPSKKTHIAANVVFGLIAVLIVVAIIAIVKDKNKNAQNKRAAATTAGKAPEEVSTGQVLHTRFFDMTADKISITESITDSSGPVNLPKEKGNQYLVIEITLKNTDAESKMMPEGELHIENGSAQIKYKNPETILVKGWGMLMENIEPGMTARTKLVYKISAGTLGKIYYYPDMSYNKDRIFLSSF